jgi:hypothetical protein
MFLTNEELAERVTDAMLAISVYHDPGTQAQILIPAISASKMLARRARCCRPHRALGWLNVAGLWCMRQFFLRVSWSLERIGTGWTIGIWRWFGRALVRLEGYAQAWAFRSGCRGHAEKEVS